MPRVGLNALEAILDAAQELFVARGFKATAVKDIAAAVDAKDAPFYNHFVGKQALFDGIIERDLAYPKTALHRGVSARGWALTRFVPRAIGRRQGLVARKSAEGGSHVLLGAEGSERKRPPCTVRRRASRSAMPNGSTKRRRVGRYLMRSAAAAPLATATCRCSAAGSM